MVVKKIGDGTSEFNNITFYAVGSGTIVENIVSYKGTDDGVEFFGGTVSAKTSFLTEILMILLTGKMVGTDKTTAIGSLTKQEQETSVWK